MFILHFRARPLPGHLERAFTRRLALERNTHARQLVGTFVYRASESPESAAANAVKGIVDRFCGGSIERVLAGLVDAALVDPRQLANIAGKLKRKSR